MTSSPPRALIADDERLMREQLRARLAEVWPELEIVGGARNGVEAVEMTASLHPDLVFLDIRMPGMTGVDAARQIATLPVDESWPGCEIVFITAYDQYAVEAFEQGVVDYVLKAGRARAAAGHGGAHPRSGWPSAATRRQAPFRPPASEQLLDKLAARINPRPPATG